MTPREALDRITALDAEDIIRERSLAEGAQWLYAEQEAVDAYQEKARELDARP